MKEVGFTAVRVHNCSPGWDEEEEYIICTRRQRWLDTAREAGLQIIAHELAGEPGAVTLDFSDVSQREGFAVWVACDPARQVLRPSSYEDMEAWLVSLLGHGQETSRRCSAPPRAATFHQNI